MDNITRKYGKDMLSYSDDAHDYVGEDEITVTITLAEYRSLVKTAALRNADVGEANKNKYEREAKIKQLTEENVVLVRKLNAICAQGCHEAGAAAEAKTDE